MNNQNILKDIILKYTTGDKKRIQMWMRRNFHIEMTDGDGTDIKQNGLGITFHKGFPHSTSRLL